MPVSKRRTVPEVVVVTLEELKIIEMIDVEGNTLTNAERVLGVTRKTLSGYLRRGRFKVMHTILSNKILELQLGGALNSLNRELFDKKLFTPR